MRKVLCMCVLVAVCLAFAPRAGGAAVPAGASVTDEAVIKAIDKGIAYILKGQKPDGTWPEKSYYSTKEEVGHTELALLTLIYTGMHPNREQVSKPLDALMGRNTDYTYAVCARAMALAHVQNKLIGEKRDLVRNALKRDVQWLVSTQGPAGGWGYTGMAGEKPSRAYQDLSNTQMAILALRDAAEAGVEIPSATWQRAQDLYFRVQKPDGSWNYGETDNRVGGAKVPGYGSMTAAGLASIFITCDQLDLASGCPCRSGKSSRVGGDVDRRIDSALTWLEKHYRVDKNPEGGKYFEGRHDYWLYSVERVGSAAGYKYFGGHDWFKEAADWLLKKQGADGSWDGTYGKLVTTSFCTLFLYKGRGPILFNKLEFDGQWNNHRRDIANLTNHVARTKEQVVHWQIVNLKGPVEELHDAPILYITAEDQPKFTDADKAKLRQFTDTGGTILFEASCGNPLVRKWFVGFAKEVWPEWELKDLAAEHGVFADPYKLKQRPALMGLDDGIRTFLIYSPDDVSCFWQTKAIASKGYMFEWGINLVAYSTDGAPLRAKLAAHVPPPDDRYKQPVKAGKSKSVRIARIRHSGNWDAGANYKGLEALADYAKKKADLSVEVAAGGVPAAGITGCDVAVVTGSREVEFSDADIAGLKTFVAGGGRLWIEAAGGSIKFDQAIRKLLTQTGWQMQLMTGTSPLVSGRMDAATGYLLGQGVKFRRALKVVRTGRDMAEVYAIMADGKPVGIYSPFDILFSCTGYEAWMCRGYAQVDALAVGTNMMLHLAN